MKNMKFLTGLGSLGSLLVLVASQTGCQSIDRAWEEQRVQRETVEVADRDRVARPRVEQATPDDLNRGFRTGQDPWGGAMRARPMRPEGAVARTGRSTGDSADILNAGLSAPLFDDWEQEPLPSPTETGRVHEVQRGESLWSISRAYGIPFTQLLEVNQMTRDTQLRIGQEIVLPTGAALEPQRTDPSPTPATGARYTVARGDTLSHIAQRHGTSVAAIRQANQLRSDTIRIGQELVIPGVDEARAPAPRQPRERESAPTADASGTHVVRAGETPAQIARQYGMRTEDLMQLNQITDARRVRIGQELRVRDTAGADAATAEASSPKLPSARPSDPGLEPGARVLRDRDTTPSPEADSRAPVIRDGGTPVRIIESDEVDFDDFGFGEDDLLDVADDLPIIETERGPGD